jgi:hypothetical protein
MVSVRTPGNEAAQRLIRILGEGALLVTGQRRMLDARSASVGTFGTHMRQELRIEHIRSLQAKL